MSKDFSPDVDANNLEPLPAKMLVDYIRQALDALGRMIIECAPMSSC